MRGMDKSRVAEGVRGPRVAVRSVELSQHTNVLKEKDINRMTSHIYIKHITMRIYGSWENVNGGQR